MHKYIFSFIFLSLLGIFCFSQEEYPSAMFGVHVEPIIPNKYFRVKAEKFDFEDINFLIIPKTGYLFGANIAININSRLSFESGINMIKRSFIINAKEIIDLRESNLNFEVSNFEIPIASTYYVQLSERLYMGHTIGISFQLLPSSLIKKERTINEDGSLFEFEQLSVRMSWIVPTYKGGVGLELRTEEKGYYYFGFVYHLFRPLYETHIKYNNGNNINKDFNTRPIGDFFGIVLRYNFNPSKLL